MALGVTIRKIVSRWDESKVLWEGEAADIKDALQKAVASGAYLSGAYLSDANLSDANLRGAYLSGAKDLRLPTGETWIEYLTETVPALLKAGGKSLDSFAQYFECHSWENCPMAHAFDVHKPEDVPILLRPRSGRS